MMFNLIDVPLEEATGCESDSVTAGHISIEKLVANASRTDDDIVDNGLSA